MLGLTAGSSQALWYLVRSSGIVDVVLLSAVVVLGVSEASRYARPGWPRFVLAGMHRNLSLLAVAILAIHIATSVGDSYVSIRVIDAFVPFVGRYHPFLLGLGALSLDVMLALVVTSLVRRWLPHAAWRAVHWAAYVCWPLAVAHGLGMGTDRTVRWVQLLNAACVLAVLAAAGWRIVVAGRSTPRPGRRWSVPSPQRAPGGRPVG